MIKLVVIVMILVGLMDYALMIASSMWEDKETYMREQQEKEQTMIDIGADLQRAFDEGYEKGKADRPQGEWEKIGEDTYYHRCPYCKRIRAFKDSRFCDWCGARMKGAANEDNDRLSKQNASYVHQLCVP